MCDNNWTSVKIVNFRFSAISSLFVCVRCDIFGQSRFNNRYLLNLNLRNFHLMIFQLFWWESAWNSESIWFLIYHLMSFVRQSETSRMIFFDSFRVSSLSLSMFHVHFHFHSQQRSLLFSSYCAQLGSKLSNSALDFFSLPWDQRNIEDCWRRW